MNDPKENQVGEKPENGMSRRVFLGTTGKLIGLGVLAHFALIGKVNAATFGVSSICIRAYACDERVYSCSSADKHSCPVNKFSCGTLFDCNPASSNSSNDKCIPAHAVTE